MRKKIRKKKIILRNWKIFAQKIKNNFFIKIFQKFKNKKKIQNNTKFST
jgi:hypothetical protein